MKKKKKARHQQPQQQLHQQQQLHHQVLLQGDFEIIYQNIKILLTHYSLSHNKQSSLLF